MWVTLVSFRNGVSGCPAHFLFANRLLNIFITEAQNVLQESVELVRCDMYFDMNPGCRSSQAEAKMTFCSQCPARLDPKRRLATCSVTCIYGQKDWLCFWKTTLADIIAVTASPVSIETRVKNFLCLYGDKCKADLAHRTRTSQRKEGLRIGQYSILSVVLETL